MSIEVRFARMDDLNDLLRLGSRFKDESHYQHLVTDTEVFAGKIRTLISDEQHSSQCVLVALAPSGELVGFLHGVLGKMIFSDQYFASEMFFYIAPRWRGSAAALRLLIAFRQWAENRGAVEIRVHTAANAFPDRFKSMLLKLGFRSFGENFTRWTSAADPSQSGG